MKRTKRSDLRPSAVQIVSAAAERRRFRRFSREGWITIFPCSDGGAGAPLRVRFRDTCVKGLGITHDTAMGVGQQFLMGLLNKTDQLAVVLFRVANCAGPLVDPSADNQTVFHIGAEPCWVLRNQKIVEGSRLTPTAIRRIHQMIELEAMRGKSN